MGCTGGMSDSGGGDGRLSGSGGAGVGKHGAGRDGVGEMVGIGGMAEEGV